LLAIAAGAGAARAHADQHELVASNSSAQNGGQDNNASSPAGVQPYSSEPGSQPKIAVVLRFAVESEPATNTSSALSAQACPQTSAAAASPTGATPSKSETVDPKVLDAISDELLKKLSKKMSVIANPAPSAIPVGALVISGCITRANGGNAATRLIGMNVGASHLDVHVVALSKTKDGWSPVDNFDIQVKGADVLPPLGPVGMAVHAARDTQQGLSADAKKVADQILKKLSQNPKARQDAAKSRGSVS
jgi:hypothetical protein